MTTDEARKLDHCPKCGEEKSKGAIVCWYCFKHRKDITPLKYCGCSFEEWLKKEG